jgi:hypothetical protein
VSESPNRRRVVAEFLLIFVGIVAALAVDRWVQGLDESRAEEEYLAFVLSDLEANAAIFDEMLAASVRAQEAAAALQSAIREDTRPSDFGLMVAVTRAGWRFEQPTREASFRDLEATGNLRLISDHALRGHIVAYFTQDLPDGRRRLEDPSYFGFRAFREAYVPAELYRGRACPREIPAFDCERASSPDATALWSTLTEDPEIARMLNSQEKYAIAAEGIARRWSERTERLLTEVREALDQ